MILSSPIRNLLWLVPLSVLLLQCAQDPGSSGEKSEKETTVEDIQSTSEITPRLLAKSGKVHALKIRVPQDNEDLETSSREILDSYKALFDLEEISDTFRPVKYLSRTSNNVLLETILLQQYQNDIPIFGARLAVHFANHSITGINGSYSHRDKAFAGATPSYTDQTIITAMASELRLRNADNDDYSILLLGTPVLKYFDPTLLESQSQTNSGYTAAELSCEGVLNAIDLIYEIMMNDSNGSWLVFIGAHSGKIIRMYSLTRDAIDLDIETGDHRPIGGTYATSCFLDFFTPWADNVYDENGVISGATTTTDTQNLSSLIDNVYDYFDVTHNWESTNGNDRQVEIVAHVDSQTQDDHAWQNAQWNDGCKHLRFGDSMVSIDILGHEFTHGIIGYTSELVYEREPGALNESYADIFGSTIKYDSGSSTWNLIGEGTVLGTIRDMSNPPNQSQPDHVQGTESNDGVGELTFSTNTTCGGTNNDFCGVHTNSGIPNKAYALIAAGGTHTWRSGGGVTVSGIGFDKAEDLYFEVLTTQLTDLSDFDEAAEVTISLAQDRQDEGSFTAEDVCAVINSFYAVGMTDDPDADCDGDADVGETDSDSDLIFDLTDNCPGDFNPLQEDLDEDGDGDACDNDDDNDGVMDTSDNCPLMYNPSQADTDANGIGEHCQDSDSDGIIDLCDNCPSVANPDQADEDSDSDGDFCDSDDDDDGLADTADNCPSTVNTDQTDTDGDGAGDVCDNCVDIVNASQEDLDSDGEGDECDDDDDGDGIDDASDNCPEIYNPNQLDIDGDGHGVECDDENLIQKFEESVDIDLNWPGFSPEDILVQRFPADTMILPLHLTGTTCSFCPDTIPVEGYGVQLDVSLPFDFRLDIRTDHGELVHADENTAKTKTTSFSVTPQTGEEFWIHITPLEEIVYQETYTASIRLTSSSGANLLLPMELF